MERNVTISDDDAAELHLTVDIDGRRLVYATDDLESIAFGPSSNEDWIVRNHES